MSDFDTLLSLALNNPKGTPAITPPASIASRVNTPFDLQADVAKVRQEGISKVQAKQAQLSQLASDKRRELGEPDPTSAPINYNQAAVGAMTGKGEDSMNEGERALRNLTPSQLIAKYGLTAANEQMTGYADALANYRNDMVTKGDRSNGEALYDSASGAVDTLSSGLLGIGALGVGAFNADAGAMITEGASQISEGIRDTQSDGIKATRRLFAAKNEIDARDSEYQYQQDIMEGKSSLVAGLSKFGSDVVSSVENVDNMALFGQGTAEGIGSILSGGVVSKGLRVAAGGEKVFRGAKLAKLRADRLGTELSDAAKRTLTADKWMWAAGVGLQEAGGTYTGTVSTIMDTPVAQLYSSSPDFVRLVQQKQASGMSKDAAEKDAKVELANEAGIVAGAAQAPLSALAGRLTNYAEKPFKSSSIGNALTNTFLKEPGEEFLQGTTGQLVQNKAVKEYANKDQDMLEGVGEAAGTGAVYGFGAAGAMQGPSTIKPVAKVAGKVGLAAGGLAAKGAFAAAKAGFSAAVTMGKPVVNALIDRGDAFLSKAGEESPVSDAKVSAAAQDIVETKVSTAIPATKTAIEASTATPEKKGEAIKYVSSLTQAIEFNEKEVNTLPEKLKTTLAGSKNRADALQRIAKHIESLPEGIEQLTAAGVLLTLMEPVNKVFESTPDALDMIPKGDPALADMKAFEDVIGSIGQTPSVVKALQTVNEILQSKQMQEMQPITAQAIATPEGKAQADAVIALATVSPESSNEGVVVGLLKMSKERRLNLTPAQEAALNNSLTIIRAAQEMNDGIAQRGLKSSKNVVSSQILSDGENKGDKRSAAVHTQGILAAMRAENIPDAAARLEQLGMFAKHMVNKVAALNEHFSKGNPFGPSITYDALNPNTNTFFPSSSNKNAAHKGAFVNTTTESSLDLAQSAELEQKALVSIYNNLVQAFPELGLDEIIAEDLDSKLIGKPAELVKKLHPNGTPKQQREAKAANSAASVKSKAQDKLRDALGISKQTAPVQSDVPTNAESEASINVWAGSNENAGLSNLATRPFTFGGKKYQSVEHAYQTLKSGSFDQQTYDKYAGTENKKIAGNRGTKTTGNANIRLMEKLMTASFEQNKDAMELLQKTGDAVITHTQDKSIWGKEFPRILMEIRESNKAVAPAAKTAPATPATTTTPTTPAAEEDGIAVANTEALDAISTARQQVRKLLESLNFKFVESPDLSLSELERIASKYLTGLHNEDPQFIKDAAKALSYALYLDINENQPINISRAVIEKALLHWLETGKPPKLEKGIWAAIHQGLNRLLAAFSSKDFQKIEDALTDTITKIQTNADFTFKPKEGYSALVFQKEMTNNPLAVRVLTSFMKSGIHFALTGSVAYADQVPVYRKENSPLHDVDLIMAPGDVTAAFEWFKNDKENWGDAGQLYTFSPNGNKVIGFALVPVGYEIRNLKSFWNVKANNPQRSYDVYSKETGEKVGSYFFLRGSEERFEGIAGVTVDLIGEARTAVIPQSFTTAEGEQVTIDVSSYIGGFAAKLGMLRPKDINDFKALVPPNKDTATPQTATAPATPATPATPVAPVAPVIKAPEKPIRKEGLNDGQKVAYEKAISFYNSDKKTFSIAGPAGSGKTFLVTSVINALRKANAGMEIVLSSPTHRANTVTRVKNPNDTVKTLHVLLGLRPNVDLSKFNAKDVQFSQGSELDDKFPNNALIIVDESSMINDELYAFLMEKVNAANGTKIIFLGDNAQLAPVNQLTPSKALTSTDDGAVLTEIMRTEDPALLDESTAVRESGSFTYKSDMKDGKGVSFTNSAKSFVELAINMFGSPAFKTNPLLVRVVAFTNNRVEKFNEVIRLGLFGENPPSYVVGELLMGYSSFGRANEKDGLTPVANGVDYIVQELVSSKVETIFGVDVTIETIKIKDIFGLEDAQTIKILSPKTPKETVKELGLAAAAVIKRAQKDRQVWKREFYPVADTYAFPFDIEYGRGKDGKPLVAMKSTLQYGYAHTIHKSQGGTYTYAMVDDQDIEASRASPSDKQKLRYVGLTRAQQGTYVYTSATLANKIDNAATAPNLEVAPVAPVAPVVPKNAFDVMVDNNEAVLKDGVYYVKNEDATKYMAGTTKDGIVYVNVAQVSSKGLEGYMKDSPQKLEMLRKMGVTAAQFASLFKDNKRINSFLAEHEKSHLKNDDRAVYPRNADGSFNLMHESAIAIEIRATMDGLNDAEKAALTKMVNATSGKANPTEFTNHSGGAKGYDAEWDLIGNQVGFKNHNHYLMPSDGDTVGVADFRLKNKGVKYTDATKDVGVISATEKVLNRLGEGQRKITIAERQLGRIEGNHVTRNSKKIRNWAQVKNADGIYAVGTLVPTGGKITISKGKVDKVALRPQVNGGTSGAVQMGINEGKVVYVFNQTASENGYAVGWYVWSQKDNDFIPTETPRLTKAYAGVGTSSETTTAGKQAIRDVFEKTLAEGALNVLPAVAPTAVTTITDNSSTNEGPLTPEELRGGAMAPASNRPATEQSAITRSMFPNLIGQGVSEDLEGNNFVLNFNLPKGDVAPNRIIGDENPIDTVRSALSSPLKLDNHIQGVAKNALTEELIDAYADVLTIHESAQDLTDDVLFQSEEELAIRRMKYLERSNEQKEFLYQLSKQRETNLGLLPAIHNVGGVMAAMQTNLNMYLSQPVSAQDNTPLNDVIESSDVQYPRTSAGKALNITERVDGKLVYNKPLLESAVLAGMQWLITAKNFETIMDDDDISRYTGIPVDELTDAMKLEISEGMSLKQAKFAIAQKIRAYWGMKSDTEANLAYKDGIVEAVAAEILRAMVDIKMVTQKTIRVEDPTGTSKDIKSVDRYIFGEFGDNLAAYPNAIDEAVLMEREEVHYLGGETPPVARTLMNDNSVQLTAAQRSAIKNEQNTPSRLNVPMLNFVNSVGINGLLELFGDGDTKGKLFNKNNLKSVEGANKAITAGFTAINATVANIENRARQFNKKASEIEVRYAYGTSSVGRMHMLGKHNAQASKLMREIMLPTWAKVDLANNAKHIEAFKYAVAQALGIKIHNLGTESFVEMDKLLTTSLAPALEIISNWVTENDLQVMPSKNPSISFPVTELIQAFKEAGIKATPVMIYALIEYSRLENMEDKSSFETALYVEADGVTNGPINAMMLMSIGAFTKDFVQNINKGGISIGEAQPMSKLDKNDLYKTSARKAKEHIAALINAIKGQSGENVPAILKHMEHLYNLLSLLMDDIQYTGGVEFSEDDLELLRGAVKNPLTVIVYGSSANGVAGKITSMVLDAFYAGLSRTLQNKSKNPALTVGEAFFPDDSNADVKFAQLNDAINALTSSQLNYDREDGFFLDAVEQKPNYTTKSMEEFTFTKGQINALRENLLIGYVEPLVAGIHETVGTSLIQAVTTMRIASQTQSIVFASMYQTAMDELLADKAKNDPYYKQGDFLSQKDLDSLNAKLAKIMPMVNTGKQVFKITGNKDLDVSETSYSRALNGTMRTAPNIQVPTNARVKAIAYMTIGTGDGLMMLLLANDGSVVGTLKVFDGMNMPLDKVEVYSQKANGAVYESYKGNPLGSVSTAYNTFLTNKEDIVKLVVDQVNKAKAEAILKKIEFKIYNVPVVAELTRTLSPYIDKDGELLPELFKALETVQTELNFAAKSADARHKAMQDVPMSVDQMASIGKPFVNGKIGLTSDSDIQDKVDALNERYNYYMAQDGTETITDEPIVAPIIAAMGEPTPTGAKVYSWGALHKITKTLTLDENQGNMLRQIYSTFKDNEYRVVVGNAEQIAAYQKSRGLSVQDPTKQDGVKGYVSIPEKTIYILSATGETLVHELIHAASYEIVSAYYHNHPLDSYTSDAVKRIEGLMDQFMTMDTSDMSEAAKEAYLDAKAAIQKYAYNPTLKGADAKAGALNEFMAWAMTNAHLSAKLKATPSLLQLALNVIAEIKNFIFGKKMAPKIGTDMLSALQFNASILMQSQTSLGSFSSDATLHHSTQSNDLRLTKLREALVKAVSTYTDVGNVLERTTKDKLATDAMMYATDLAVDVSAVFPMNMEEQVTFVAYVKALSTQAKLDPSAMAKAQEMFVHVTKKLTVDDFIDPNISDDGVARYEAAQKFDVIMGKSVRGIDASNRSALLPIFIALGSVNKEFRDVLKNIATPAFIKDGSKTFDAALDNFGNSMIDKLGNIVAGTSKATNVTQAIDALNESLYEDAFHEKSMIELVGDTTGGKVDQANDFIQSKLQSLSNAGMGAGQKLLSSNSNVKKAGGAVLQAFSAIVAENSGDEVARGIISLMNQKNVPKPLYNLINDLVGRTTDNAAVYDLIKKIRAQVHQVRQQFREQVPKAIASKFGRPLLEKEWSSLFRGLGKSDLASLVGSMSSKDVLSLVSDNAKMANEISNMESMLEQADPAMWAMYQSKMKQLANYMNTGNTGVNLLRNANAVAMLLSESKPKGWVAPGQATVAMMDKLISLYAVDGMAKADKDNLTSLINNEPAGVQFALDYLVGQRKDEMAKAQNGKAKFNHYKGYIPSVPKQGVDLIVADDSEYTRLRTLGYSRVGAYTGSDLDGSKGKRSYYFRPLSGNVAFSQGMMQNVKHTASGVDDTFGFSTDSTAGRITDPLVVKQLSRRMGKDTATTENLVPVYDEVGNLIAYEKSLDPRMTAKLGKSENLAKMIGIWRGRQVEEKMSQDINEELINNLHVMYTRDIASSAGKKAEYINLLDTASLDPVQRDAVSLFSHTTKNYIEATFGTKGFWVRKDMLDDVTGYRSASVGDVFTGNTRWSPETQRVVRNALIGMFGADAFRKVMNAEQFTQNMVSDLRTLIVVKSVIVPMANMTSNIYQLISRGVPLRSIGIELPKKLAEIEGYTKNRIRQIELEAEIRAVGSDVVRERKLRTELQSITDSYTRLSIWPLLQAGEFSSISDVGMTADDLELSSGKAVQWIEKQIDNLPDGMKTAVKNGYIARDTSLFQGLQKSVQYGDFIAKAILYDDLVNRKKLSSKEALGRITEEFVNYDRMPGRSRAYLENMGMLWFFNYKIRIAKVGLSMIRNNPLHALMVAGLPTPGGVGTPITDNIFSKAMENTLGYSVGPGMAFHAGGLNPVINIIN